MTAQAIDQARAEAFAGQMVGLLNNAMAALLVSAGHRTGLFDDLATMAPSTSVEIAKATGLNERYVREWLGGMTAARIVEHDPAKQTYWLPAEHAASLTRAAGPGNLATMSQYVSMMGNVEDQIVECFRSGGGVPYSAFPTFQELMAQESGQVFDATLIDARSAYPGSAASGWRRASTSRYRLRCRLCHQSDGQGVSEQPLHRLRLLRRGPRNGSRPSRSVGPHQRRVRSGRRGRRSATRQRSRHGHRVRLHPRPGTSAQVLEGHLATP